MQELGSDASDARIRNQLYPYYKNVIRSKIPFEIFFEINQNMMGKTLFRESNWKNSQRKTKGCF